MKYYVFFFRWRNSAPFQYLSIFIAANSNEDAIKNFHTVFSAAGYLHELENRTYSIMGERSCIDDITVTKSSLVVTGFTFLFGDDPINQILKGGI